MSCILHIETSTDVCSVAVSEDAQVIFEQDNLDELAHIDDRKARQGAATLLAPLVRDALSFADSHAIPVDAVAVSSGPGSYTGLRIGVSEAKGVAYGLNIPLIEVPTLKLMCVPLLLYREDIEDDALLCPMIDARRMEVYAAVYNRALRPVRDVQADIVTEETYRELLDRHIIYFFGSGNGKCKEVINHPNARFIPSTGSGQAEIVPLAKHMAPLAEMAHARGEFVDTAYFEPFYLKEFQATVAKDQLRIKR